MIKKALHLRSEQRHQRRVHAGNVDTLAGFERFDGRHRLSQNGRVRRVGTKLRPQHFAERPAPGRYQDQPANVRQLLRGRERNKTALAVPEQPNARHARFLPDNANPSADIGDIIIDRHRIGVGNRRTAGKHAALVDADRADAALGKSFRQQPVGRGLDAERIIAVTIGRTRTGNDQHHGEPA